VPATADAFDLISGGISSGVTFGTRRAQLAALDQLIVAAARLALDLGARSS
jgi:hypothetical protein